MKVAFITRSTLYKVPGGDTIQITETAKHLRELNIEVKISLSHEKINYKEFDLLHFFNLIRPADILYHVKRSKIPYVISPILVDYSEYDQYHRKGLSGWILKTFSSPEYIKTISRWILLKDNLQSKEYLWKGQRRTIVDILEKAKMVLPNSASEYNRLESSYFTSKPYAIIPNGINENIFRQDYTEKDEKLVVCAARIEGIKNQMNLIKALNNTSFTLVLIGESSANQKQYYEECKRIAGRNIVFTGRLRQEELVDYFKKAKVHVLPSWFETCGLSSLEAAATGCNIVVTDKGFSRDYFSNHAFYCNPNDVESIYNAVFLAATSNVSNKLQEKIATNFTWSQAARKTLEAYKTCLNN
jgi:glycosyltransferase involved in cell wall biosynthesis